MGVAGLVGLPWLQPHMPGEELAQSGAADREPGEDPAGGGIVLHAHGRSLKTPVGEPVEDHHRGDRGDGAACHHGQQLPAAQHPPPLHPREHQHSGDGADDAAAAAAEKQRATGKDDAGADQEDLREPGRGAALPQPFQRNQQNRTGQQQLCRVGIGIHEMAVRPGLAHLLDQLLREDDAGVAGILDLELQIVRQAAEMLMPALQRRKQRGGGDGVEKPWQQLGVEAAGQPDAAGDAGDGVEVPVPVCGVAPLGGMD